MQRSREQVTRLDSKPEIFVCQYKNCLRQGSAEVLAAFQACGDRMTVIPSDCLGQCSVGPTVRVTPDEVWYCMVQAKDVPEIVSQHIQAGQPVRSLLHPRFHPGQRV